MQQNFPALSELESPKHKKEKADSFRNRPFASAARS
ncbi:hypothetical protein OCEANICA350_10736 [Oceanicaulis sp. 350]|nr:hypothetical protein OCEANICA350_10736 [Oceanicaulis sp. 350]